MRNDQARRMSHLSSALGSMGLRRCLSRGRKTFALFRTYLESQSRQQKKWEHRVQGHANALPQVHLVFFVFRVSNYSSQPRRITRRRVRDSHLHRTKKTPSTTYLGWQGRWKKREHLVQGHANALRLVHSVFFGFRLAKNSRQPKKNDRLLFRIICQKFKKVASK